MRLCAVVATPFWACCLLLAWAASAAAEQFPYRGVINADDVYVRSGPGQDYYPTEKLKKGEIVEVYRHDPGGWYAVRPPASSYSWVSARYVREAGDGLLEVTMDGVVARVGSTLNQARDVWQVKLRKGELLEMLDPGPGESGAWYRVAPPSGEFRWVYGRYVHPVSGEGEVQEADGSVQVEPQPVARSRREDQSVRPAHAEEMVSQRRPAYDGRVAEEPRRLRDEQPVADDEYVSEANAVRGDVASLRRTDGAGVHRPASYQANDDRPARSPRNMEREPVGEPADAVADRPRARTRTTKAEPPARAEKPGSISLELERLEAELAFAVAQEASIEQLQDLFDRAVDASDRVRNEKEAQQAEALIERIRRFAALRRQIENAEERMLLTIRQQQKAARAERARNADRAVSFAKPADGEIAADYEPDAASVELVESKFDGEGRLVPVYSKKIGAPQYALLDQENRVRAYVTAAPGVNLRAYEGRQIGIIGSRGYSAELKAPHVIAQRVEVLTARLR